jgi:hypothetical protein
MRCSPSFVRSTFFSFHFPVLQIDFKILRLLCLRFPFSGILACRCGLAAECRINTLEAIMNGYRTETVLQNMGSLLFMLAEATELLLEQNVGTLARPVVAEQRRKAQAIHQAAASLRGVLGSLESNQ